MYSSQFSSQFNIPEYIFKIIKIKINIIILLNNFK